MKLITSQDIDNLNVEPHECVKWVKEALRNKTMSQLPPKVSISPNHTKDGTFVNTMPCFVDYLGRGGVKVVSRYPGRAPSLGSEILLYDALTGDCLAMLDGDWITAARTGAVAAQAIEKLAVPDFTRLGMMGLGSTARTTLACVAAIYPERKFDIGLLRYKKQHDEFARHFASHENLHFRFVDDAAALAKESQVLVSCVTVASGDFCPPSSFASGSLLVPVHTRGFKECDLAFDKIVCDDEGHVASFGYYPQFKDKLVEMADVLSGKASGRESDSQRIIAYNIGIALHDIVFASKIYDKLANDASLAEVNLHGA